MATGLDAYRAKTLPWRDVEAACLLSGPPGTGKTTFARALAATCRVPLVSGSYADWMSNGTGHQGDLLRSMRASFAEARRQAPSILFLDEIDSFPDRATLHRAWADWMIQVVNALLAEIDGIGGRDGIVLVAACNHPDKLDPALVRSGRLDRHVRIPLPNPRALRSILREHLGGDLPGAELSSAALLLDGASGADCERAVKGARRRAREAGRPVAPDDLLAEISGPDRPEGEVLVASVHEAGHAVAALALFPGALRSVSIRNGGSTGGGCVMERSEAILTSDLVGRRLVTLLAGRAAEEALLGAPSAGAGGSPASDLASATLLAAQAAAILGLDPKSGLLWSGPADLASLPGMFARDRQLARRVRAALDGAYAEALALVSGRRGAVAAIAEALRARGAMDGASVARVVAGAG